MLSARNKLGLLAIILATFAQQPIAIGQTVGDQSSLTNAVTQASVPVPPADIYKIPAKKLFGAEKIAPKYDLETVVNSGVALFLNGMTKA